MTDGVNKSGQASISEIMGMIDLGPTDSIQFMFAKLQLAQAQICKNAATDYMNQIESVQQEQKEVAEMISKARELQNKCDKKNKNTTEMPDDMKQWMQDHGLAIENTGKDDLHNYSEWTYNIESLTNYQESISNKTQTLMVYLQDFISQYNSYVQGANSAISQAAQVTTAVATGR